MRFCGGNTKLLCGCRDIRESPSPIQSAKNGQKRAIRRKTAEPSSKSRQCGSVSLISSAASELTEPQTSLCKIRFGCKRRMQINVTASILSQLTPLLDLELEDKSTKLFFSIILVKVFSVHNVFLICSYDFICQLLHVSTTDCWSSSKRIQKNINQKLFNASGFH